jgi:ribonuclease D
MTLPGVVSEDLMVNLKFPLSEVTELAFVRLVDTTIASKLCGMSGQVSLANTVYC